MLDALSYFSPFLPVAIALDSWWPASGCSHYYNSAPANLKPGKTSGHLKGVITKYYPTLVTYLKSQLAIFLSFITIHCYEAYIFGDEEKKMINTFLLKYIIVTLIIYHLREQFYLFLPNPETKLDLSSWHLILFLNGIYNNLISNYLFNGHEKLNIFKSIFKGE